MKRFTQTLIVVMGFIVFSTMVLAGDLTPAAVPAHSSGNQLTQGYIPWYEKAAETAGPVKGMAGKNGVLLTLQPGSVLYMEGNSTLHKYQMNAHELKGSAVLEGSAKDLAKSLKGGKVKSMTIIVPLAAFKSKESGLDNNAYKALGAKENPEIKFELTSETLKAGPDAGTYAMTALGKLTIAGATVPVTLTAETTVKGDLVHLKGAQKLKMTDFKIKPPSISVLIMSITCSDEIEIHYDVTFASK